MKDELNGKLVEILTSIQNATGKAADFALNQLPDIAQSYVLYGRVYETVLTLIALGFSIALFVLAKWAIKKSSTRGNEEYICLAIPSGFFSIVSFILFVSNLKSLSLVWLAPKVWLIKELASLIK